MLTHLKVKDFQSISDINIELGQYTVFVGRSNSGKSAILRALHTLVRNSFIPSYVRTGVSSTHISVQFDSMHTISTIRGKESTYSYVLGDDAPEVYTKCGRAVPEEIEKLLALPLVADEDVFFTNQFELPFLVGGKATKASAVMGTLTNAMLVNSLAQETNRVRLNTKQRITVRQEDLGQLQVELNEFDDLVHLENALTCIQHLYDEYVEVSTRHDELQRLFQRVESIDFVEVPTVPSLNHELDVLLETYQKAQSLSQDISRAEAVTLAEVPQLVIMDDWLFELENLTHRERQLDKMLLVVQNQKEKYIQSFKELEKVGSEIHLVEVHLRTFDVCPECGQVLV